MKRCVVLGGNGFIGRHVCSALQAQGYDVTALVRDKVDHPGYATKQIKVDLHNAQETSKHFQDTDYVLCLAPSSLPATAGENIAADVHAHVEPTIRLAEYAANLGVEKFVFASSGGTVYGNCESPVITENMPTRPISAYGASKLAIENYLAVIKRHCNIKTMSLRISNPYGVGQNINKGQGFISTVLESYLRGTPVTIWGDGEIYRDFLNVSDVAYAMTLALQYDGEHSVFNIGSGTGYSLNQILKIFEKITQSDLQVIYEPSRSFDVTSNILSNSLALEQLNWIPLTSIEEGITNLVNYQEIQPKTAA